ncbi:retrovirus-related pol polyprotein from transposon TNT 1-94 [Tanacetum coccineum]
MTAGQRKPEGQWTRDERNAANLDQRLKSLIMSVLPDDQLNFVINCFTAKSTWDDLILYHEGPSNVKESRVMDLKLCYNTFEFKEGETLTQTFTRYKDLINELVNDGIKLLNLEINTSFINRLSKKWLSFCQSLRNTNHVKDSELAFLFGKLKYEENLIDIIYETEKIKSLVSATPLSTAFISTSIVQDFQYSPDDEEDTRSNHEYLNDLEEEYQARALLAKSKRFFKKGTQRFSSAKATDQNECHKFGKKELRPTKDFESKYNKVKAKLALLSLSASASKAATIKNKGLIAKAYERDEEECISEQIPSQKKRIIGVDQLTEDPSSSGQKDLAFVKSSADDKKVSIPGIERPWLSEAEGFILPNHDTADKSLVCSTPLPPLKKLDGAESISGPKTIKSILRSKSTFKAKTLKCVIINEPSSAPVKGNKSSSALKVNSAPTGNLKSVKIKDDPHLAIVIKELNDLKLQLIKNQSSYSENNQHVPQNALQNKYKTQFKKSCDLYDLNNHLSENFYKVLFCQKYERTDHRTCDYAEYVYTKEMSQHLKSLGRSSSRSKIPRPSKRFFPPCIHYGCIDHLSNECLYYPICRLCGSYDHDTNGHNRIISLEREINPRNPQHAFKRCEAYGSLNHTTTDHYDIEWFKRGEALQAKKAKALKSTRDESSNANKFKTPTKRKPIKYLDSGCSRHMTGVKSFLHKYMEQPGPKVMFRDDSTCTTECYGSIKYNGLVFTKVAFVNGLKPVTPRSINHEKYTLVIVDEYSRYTCVYFLKKKSQAPETIMSFIKRVENQNDIKVKQLRTDNGTEFRNNIPVNFYDEKRILQKISSTYTPEQNDVGKRKNRTLIEAARTMLSGSVFSKQYWTEVVATACYTQNRSTIMKRHLKTPYEIFRKRIPNINFLHVFGCPVYIHNHKDHLGKFDEKADDGYLLGYSLVSKAFRVFNTRRQQTEETYHITFDESPDAIKFSKPSVDNINIAENERYPPDEYLHPYEPSQRYQTNNNDVSFIEPYECPEPVVLETEVSSDQNGQTDQNDHNDQNDQSVQNDEILNDDHSEHSNHTNDEQIIDNLPNTKDIQISEHSSSPRLTKDTIGPRDKHIELGQYHWKSRSLDRLTEHMAKELSADFQLHEMSFFRYQANPKESHLIVVKRIFRYLKGAYQLLGGKLVPLFCDNTSAIAISNNPVLHSRTKHINIRYHFIRDHVLKGDIELHFIPTQYQLADIFTMPLDEPTFKRLIVELGMLNIDSKPEASVLPEEN